MKQESVDVIVIGAGAAGLMCAIEAGKRGRRVLVLDHANRIGKKILLSGGGRCNFTNIHTAPANFLSSNPHFCKSALSRYTPQDFIAMVERHNIPWHEKKLGQLFCDNSAKDIVAMLADECKQARAQIRTRISVDHIEKSERFRLTTSDGEFDCESLVIATGGLSFPTMGASDFGYRVAHQFGLPVLPTRAALVPFVLNEPDRQLSESLSGVSVDAEARVATATFRENILFTHRGLSGPAVLQVSSYWDEQEPVHFNLLPEYDAAAWLLAQKQQHPNRQLTRILADALPRRLAEALVKRGFANRPLQTFRDNELQSLGETLNTWSVRPSSTEGYRSAEVTLGGVDTGKISQKTMESRAVSGLFFIGEVLDVTGWLGGYNFQWAWASGYCAGQTA
jgi:hypothetical protein